MLIMDCDYHAGFQQIALIDTDTGEFREQRLEHSLGTSQPLLPCDTLSVRLAQNLVRIG